MFPLYTPEAFQAAKSFTLLPLKCQQCPTTIYRTKKALKYAILKGKEKFFCPKCLPQSQVSSIEVACLTCGVKFLKRASQCKKTPNHFCSRSCAVKTNNVKTPKRKVEGSCRTCQKPTHTKDRYCSDSCKEVARQIWEAERELEWQKPPVKVKGPRKPRASSGYKKIGRSPAQKREDGKAGVVAWRQRTKLKAIEYKGGCCQTCGYRKCVWALSFHHVDPSQKDFGIGGRNLKSWARIQVELDKCVLICSNCHAEVHDALDSTPDAKAHWRKRLKIKAIEYKGGHCCLCGYHNCNRALSFHHLDPSQKDFNISRVSRTWESIQPELDKCVLLCMNCHGEVHAGTAILDSMVDRTGIEPVSTG